MYLTIIKYNIIIYNENDVIVLSMLSDFDSCKKGLNVGNIIYGHKKFLPAKIHS